ncbi:MAG: hypothetical protein Q8R44_20575, partial [Novosphingobium sp.]|nr:hypothetical protein [Novosphingobium sp.]
VIYLHQIHCRLLRYGKSSRSRGYAVFEIVVELQKTLVHLEQLEAFVFEEPLCLVAGRAFARAAPLHPAQTVEEHLVPAGDRGS